jgi:hypothetical protein
MAVKAQIESGTTSSKGRILYQAQDGQPQISYQGEMSIDGVKIKDRCIGNHCMWWDKQGCAVVLLSRDIRKTMQAIHKEIKYEQDDDERSR